MRAVIDAVVVVIGLACFVVAFILLRKAAHHISDWRT